MGKVVFCLSKEYEHILFNVSSMKTWKDIMIVYMRHRLSLWESWRRKAAEYSHARCESVSFWQQSPLRHAKRATSNVLPRSGIMCGERLSILFDF